MLGSQLPDGPFGKIIVYRAFTVILVNKTAYSPDIVQPNIK